VTDSAGVEELLVRLAPDGTGVAACQTEPSLAAQLSPDEHALDTSRRMERRAEFAAGRFCAHRALAAIGADTATIGRGPRRQPLWPAGVTGSISHAAGLAAAVAAPATSSVRGLGIDVELAASLDEELWPHVLTPAERSRCLASDDPVVSATTVFCAKEATFKALYPLFGVEIDFLDATSLLEANAGLDVRAGDVRIDSLGVSAAIRHGRTGPLVVSLAIVA
jgi:4'-phosphopantetheinyl transferase EntD